MKKGEKFERVNITPEEYKKLDKFEKKIRTAKLLRRIQNFKLIYLGWKYIEIAEFLSVTKNTISNWIQIYNDGGIPALMSLKYKGGIPRLNKKQLLELKKEAKKGSFVIAKDLQHYIKINFGLTYNLSHIQKLSKKNFCYPLNRQD